MLLEANGERERESSNSIEECKFVDEASQHSIVSPWPSWAEAATFQSPNFIDSHLRESSSPPSTT